MSSVLKNRLAFDMTALRNPDGSSIIPTLVPPTIEFPFLPQSHSASQTATPKSTISRPRAGKAWQTERPRPSKRPSRPLPRIGTNVSALNQVIWNAPGYEEESSSEEEMPLAESGDLRSRRAKKARKGLGEDESDRRYSRFAVGNEHYNTRGHVSQRDGRLHISVNEANLKGYLAKSLDATFKRHEHPESSVPDEAAGHIRAPGTPTDSKKIPLPKLNIVVMVIGSRGDIQPFLKIGKILKEEHGHRVRIATHPAFRDFVQKDSGLEFFSVGGDPAELMAFMVKNPGMIPKMETVRAGEIGRRREQMAEMFEGFWRACINATDDENDPINLKMMGDNKPFVADVIIANPPCFAHVHCAERLGVPLHLMFTFPYTPTHAFPHPLANIKQTNVEEGYTNFMSYPLVEMMTWQGLGDLINDFRTHCLGLEPVSTLWAPGQLYRLKVPYTYLWSPGLIPKPKDWGPEIDISGFVFLDLASTFKPPNELVNFLNAGVPPVYIGFGSIVVDDPDVFTKMIFDAVKKAGVRALVSKGWGGLGGDDVPDDIFMLENTPHDWLFPRVSAVCHHGGAGTTAIGLKCGKPTFIVPFFGDQQFWGSMVGKAGAGADPVPYKSLTMDKMAEAIKKCLSPEAKEAAEKIAKSIEVEGDGAQNAVKSFHRSLMLRGEQSMRCSILEDRCAVWHLKRTNLRLSALAAEILVEKRHISCKQLRLIRHQEWNDFEGPGEPLSGMTTSIAGTLTGIASGVGSIPYRIARSSKRQQKHLEKTEQKRLAVNRNRSGKPSDTMVNEGAFAGETKNQPQSKEPKTFNEKDRVTQKDELGKKTQRGTPMIDNSHTNHNDENKNASNGSSDSESEENMTKEYARDIGKGIGKSGEALALAPMDLALAIAQGFHNAPRLYGDNTVRRPLRITGVKSGMKAAGKEFVYGIYDGVTGVVKQPYKGAKENGAVGCIKGLGMGLTGFVLKDIGAIIGPFAYSAKGVHRQFLKGNEPTHFIRKARIIQGQRDMKQCRLEDAARAEAEDRIIWDQVVTKEEKMVEHGWSVVQQVWKIMEDKRAKGLKGKLDAFKERKTWRINGAFDNVEMAEKALEATRKGESLEDVFRLQREELRKSQLPWKEVAKDIEEEKHDAGVGDLVSTGDGTGVDDGGKAGNDEAADERRDEEMVQRERTEREQLRTARNAVLTSSLT